MKANISKLESFATLDGDGIRFEIFFQGCPLRCHYCHNPETWEFKPNNQTSVKDLVKQILRYKEYFGFNGGVTLSGGEPLMQVDFLIKLCKKLKKHKIHVALDTSGCVINDKVKKLLKYVDLVLLDLKHNTENNYKKFARGSLNNTLQFLKLLNELNISTWLRTVIVPNLNNSEAEVKKYYNLIKEFNNIAKYELLGFHTLGFTKYQSLNLNNPLSGTAALKKTELNKLQKYLNDLFFKTKSA